MERGAVRAEDKESRNCQPGGKSNVEAGWEREKLTSNYTISLIIHK
jgi:hypothetical protein